MEEDHLRLRLDFHRESVILHDYAGKVVKTKLVSALDVAHALARELDLATGILPPETLWWARTSSGTRVAIWREPRVWTVRLRESHDAPPRRLRLPIPGLVFLCLPARQAPYVFAASARPRSIDDQLYHAPAYNVFNSGRVCTGTHAFPADSGRVPEEFFRSYFSATNDTARGKSRKHPDDVGRLWDEINGTKIFPVEDLVPQLHVGEALRIGN
jgi:PRTRC genetic system protein B